MRVRLSVAALLAVGALFAWGPGASTQVTSSSGGATPSNETSVDVPRAVVEQAQIQQAKLVEHHQMLVDQNARIQRSLNDHEARMARQLGDRAPKETISPMETIAPLETASPFDD